MTEAGDSADPHAALAERLQQSEETLQQLAYAISHDLQEPLRMVSSYVQLIGRRYIGQLDADADDFIGFAVDGTQRMQAMIDDLLAYSRVRARGGPMVPVNARAAVDEAVRGLAGRLEEAGVRVEAGTLPSVVADLPQLTQVFHDLLANVAEHGGAHPKVRIDAETAVDETVFHVADDGPGVDLEDQVRIFVIFQSPKARDQRRGTGAGLAIARRIVERHGGRMRVESEPGSGATLSFTVAGAATPR